MTGIQIQESQIPQELRNLQPSVNMGDSILITEIHECLGAYCDDAQGRVKKFSGMTLGGTFATTEDGVFAKSWVKVNEPVEVGDRILLLERYSRGLSNVGSVVKIDGISAGAPLFSGGAESTGLGIARTWVKLPALAKSTTTTTFKAGDVVRYHDRELPGDLVPTPEYLIGTSGIVAGSRHIMGHDYLSTNIAEGSGYNDARRFELVDSPAETPKQEEPQAPFQVGDWVKDVSDNDRIGKVSEDVSFEVNVKYTDNHRGAFKVEYVDGKPSLLRYAFGRELEKLEVNPKVQVGDYITVLERAYWGNQEVDLPYTGRVDAVLGLNHHVSVSGDMPLVGRTYIKADTPMAQSSVDEPPFKIGDVVRYSARTVGGLTPINRWIGVTGKVASIKRSGYSAPGSEWYVVIDTITSAGNYSGRFDLVTEEKPAPKFKVGDLAVVNGKGNSWAIPEGSLVEIVAVNDPYFKFTILGSDTQRYERYDYQLDPWTEEVQPGDKVVLTKGGISYITPEKIVDVVGTVAEVNSIYHAIDGLWAKGNILLSSRTELQKWTPQREAEARKFLAKLQAEQGEAAREKKLAELKQATVVKQDRYLYLSESGSHDWAEYKPNGENGIHSKHLICTDNPDADDYEIVK
ncbi:MAG: hypothetical protein IPG94_22440 [Kineosporiaceae bacterium]|nr:hypothetical protein [Kineosporiaceae bacterium]